MNKVNSFKELEVYQLAFKIQQEIFVVSRHWPKQEERGLLADGSDSPELAVNRSQSRRMMGEKTVPGALLVQTDGRGWGVAGNPALVGHGFCLPICHRSGASRLASRVGGSWPASRQHDQPPRILLLLKYRFSASPTH